MKQVITDSYMPSGQEDLKVCVWKNSWESLGSLPLSLTSGACPSSRGFCWFRQGSGPPCSCMFCPLFLALHSGSSGRMSWQHRWLRSQSHVWWGWSESSSPGCQGLRLGSVWCYQEGFDPDRGVLWILYRSVCKTERKGIGLKPQ